MTTSRSSRPVTETLNRRLRSLVNLTRRLSEPNLLEEVMPIIVREVLGVLDMDRGVLLLDQGTGGYETVVSIGRFDEAYTERDQSATKSIFAEAKASRRPVVSFLAGVPDPDGDSSFWSMGSIVGLPLLDRNRFLGALCLASEHKRANLEGDHLAFIEAVAAVAALALTNARAHTRILEAERLSADFGGILLLGQVLERALTRIVELTRAEQGFLMLRDRHTGRLKVECGTDRRGQPLETGERFLSLKVAESVAASGEAVLSDNVAEMDGFGDEDGSVIQFGLTSILCVPVRARNAVLGVVYLENRMLAGVFDDQEKRLVQLVADRAGMAIENAKLYEQERAVLGALANAVEARDMGTSSHVQRVSRHAVAVGACLGLSAEALVELEQSALLHDIGKIGIPDRVLLKQGPLDAEEWALMKKHPEMGLGIVAPVALPRAVREGIVCHQESWDGSGYPFGLKGEAIPLFGRIIAVVDAFDAMVTNRPYRKARSTREAMAELNRCAGGAFDPEIVLAFLSVLEIEEEDDPT